MALSTEEKQKVSDLKKQGFSTTEITGFIASERAGKPSLLSKKLETRNQLDPNSARADLSRGFQGAQTAFQEGLNRTEAAGQRGTLLGRTAGRIGAGFRFAGEALGSIGEGALRALPGGTTAVDTIEAGIGAGARAIGSSRTGQAIGGAAKGAFEALPQGVQQTLGDVGNVAMGAAGIGGSLVAPGVASTASRAVGNMATRVVGGIEIPDIKVGDPFSIFKTQPVSVDDAIKQADQSIKMNQTTNVNLQNQVNVNVPETKIDITSVNQRLDKLIEQGNLAEARALAEATAPKLTIAEKWAGIRPDIKNRIQGKSELMREYFDVTHARNSNDRIPGVQEYAASYAQEAVNIMENQLRETGGDIGRIREKLGTIQAPRPQVESINNTWSKQLDSLNLREVNGQIVQKPGTQSRLQAAGDLKVINDLNQELRILNQNPSLTNIIDFRTNLDGRINFAKSSREASSSVDGLSRSMRTQLAESANTIVGKSGAADVAKYSEFMEALNDLKSFTDRKAGAEYMLKLVLSGRGREARQIMDTVKEQTGIDLIDHATMMQISTELIANEAQKNLFRQELTKSGLDTARLLGGDASGAAATIFNKTFERLVDSEKIFLQAAE